jgi:hypothetical protein
MKTRQQELVDMVAQKTRYHLGLDGHEVTEAQARNLAAHLVLVVPEWRAVWMEAGRARRGSGMGAQGRVCAQAGVKR